MSLAGLNSKRRGDGDLYSALSARNMDTPIGIALLNGELKGATSVQHYNAGDVISLGMPIMNAHTIIKSCCS